MTRANQILRAALAKQKRHKYRAKPVTVDGIRFHSTREAARYRELTLMQKAGAIRGLECQPKFPLYVSTNVVAEEPTEIGCYVADFAYESLSLGREDVWEDVIEDVKGVDTPLSKWKRKHVAAQYGITVEIVK